MKTPNVKTALRFPLYNDTEVSGIGCRDRKKRDRLLGLKKAGQPVAGTQQFKIKQFLGAELLLRGRKIAYLKSMLTNKK